MKITEVRRNNIVTYTCTDEYSGKVMGYLRYNPKEGKYLLESAFESKYTQYDLDLISAKLKEINK